jgi:hypothetical protein
MPAKGADAITTIQLRRSTRDRLQQLGRKGETYDAILNRVLDQLPASSSHAPGHPPERQPGHARRHKGVVDFEPVD